MPKVLTLRALNRTYLERQYLLRPRKISALAAIEHLVGLQAQAPFDPYQALFNRIRDFEPEELANLLLERSAVRIALMRSTIHLVSARDCLALRPVMQSVSERGFMVGSPFGRRLGDFDYTKLVRVGRKMLEAKPLSNAELAKQLAPQFPEHDAEAMVNALRTHLPLVQVTPRGVWGKSGRATLTTAQAWLGAELGQDSTPDQTVLRYLRAFGPATVNDVQTWSGLTRLTPVLERLAPKLRILHDEDGRPLYDLPSMTYPAEDTPAPVHFMPEFDNLFLSHADRRRVIPGASGAQRFIYPCAFLLDGFVGGSWKLLKERTRATLLVAPHDPLSKGDRDALLAEAERVLAFHAPGVQHDVRLEMPGKKRPAKASAPG